MQFGWLEVYFFIKEKITSYFPVQLPSSFEFHANRFIGNWSRQHKFTRRRGEGDDWVISASKIVRFEQ